MDSGIIKYKYSMEVGMLKLKDIYDEVDFKITKYKGHASQIAKDSCNKYSHIIISGGDGTLNEVINGIAEQDSPPTIGYIPSGTINDISRSLNIPKNINKALKIIKDNIIINHDIFKINDKYGIYASGIGAFTSTSWDTKQNSKKLFGKIAYFFHGINEVFHLQDFELKISSENSSIRIDKCVIMLLLNSRSTAGFLLNSRANLSDGKVDAVFVRRPSKGLFPTLITIFNIAKIFLFDYKLLRNNKYITKARLSNFYLENDKRCIFNIDGEQGPYGNINFKVINNGIKFICPAKTIKQQSKLK